VSELLLEAVAAPYANADPPTSVSLIYMHVIFEKQDVQSYLNLNLVNIYIYIIKTRINSPQVSWYDVMAIPSVVDHLG
jgi:hypothetical protein